jgi:hypothetical protein
MGLTFFSTLVIRKVPRLGGENSRFQHNRASNVYVTGNENYTQISFSSNFGGKLIFIPYLLFPEQ